jgi:hypothetical protein
VRVQVLIALGITMLAHVAGAGVLIWMLLDGEKIDWRSFWPRDDDGRPPEGPPEPEPVAPRGGLPLPDAAPSAVRLRAPGRLGDAHPRPARRPEHAPERTSPGVPHER